MLPQQFVVKWKRIDLSERATYQQHFCDLCDLLGVPKPLDADPAGTWFTFEFGLTTVEGGKGWADVFRRGCFGWEYKGKHKDLNAAYLQLLKYREALENPPLLIVCDTNWFRIHTNFTGTAKRVHEFNLDGLADSKNLQLLRDAFLNPEALRPGQTQKGLTEDAANTFGNLAEGMRERGIPAQQAAHFLMKLMFCMFAEDIGLLPTGVFEKTLTGARGEPARLTKSLHRLFDAMANGEPFGADDILHFNGGLFADSEVIDLTAGEIAVLLDAARCDWSQVEPSIFGSLFERTLDPDKRAQIGAHYTSREDIETLLRPVLMEPLRREWAAVRERADKLWAKSKGAKAGAKPRREFEKCLTDFLDRLAHVTVLDPACGSGNFLYVALNMLLDLEKDVLTYAAAFGINRFPFVRPTQLRGLEINPYARELAQVVIWIGFLQWMRFNGFVETADPVLDPMENIRQTDAILDLSDLEHPKEPRWPDAEFIVSNPPFLGANKIRAELGDPYVQALFKLYDGRVPAFSDLCCYWFEKSRAQIRLGKTRRAGLLATQGIRGGANRTVLERIKETGDIFFAISDTDWVLDGATVHISMVGFDDGAETTRRLDGKPVETISASLSSKVDVTGAKELPEALGKCFMGASKKASFDIDEKIAHEMLLAPNPNRKPNSDVVRPWANGIEITRRPQHIWIIDFGNDMPEAQAALYEMPFEYAARVVRPERARRREAQIVSNWWRFARPRVEMRQAIRGLSRYLVTPAVAKHRTFAWVPDIVVPDQQLLVCAFEDDYALGVLHSRLHETWARAPGMGTQVRERESGFRYTPTTCFETFPFPEPTPAQREAIAAAARELDTLRNNWLNPPEWTRTETLEFPGSLDGPWRRYVHDADARGIGTVRYPRLVPKDAASSAQLAKRTLTNLYNERPAWLGGAHHKLDEAVFAAYGWPADLSDDALLAKLLDLNLARAAAPANPARAAQPPPKNRDEDE